MQNKDITIALKKDITFSLMNEEFGDARSLLDEHYWPCEDSNVLIQLLNNLSSACWFYDESDGWTYEEI